MGQTLKGVVLGGSCRLYIVIDTFSEVGECMSGSWGVLISMTRMSLGSPCTETIL